MSSGRRHHSQNLVWGVGIGMLLTAILVHQRGWADIPYILAGLFAFLLAITYVTPDLDLWHSHPRKAWGKLSFMWAPFAWAVKHRGWQSHSFIIGTLIRLAYILNLLWIITATIFYLLFGSLHLIWLACALGMYSGFILLLDSNSVWRLLLLIAADFIPLSIWFIGWPPTVPWALAVIGGFIIGDVFHLVYDRIDSFYIGRPKKNGRPQGWRR